MGQFLNVNVKTTGKEEFDGVLKEYRKWNDGQPQDIATAKAYFIDLNAMEATKVANPNSILEKLKASSKKYSGVPLDAILVNSNLGKKGKKGLTGQKMADAVVKFDKKQQSKISLLRSGWIQGAKTLDFWKKKGDVNFSKKFAPKRPSGIREYGRPKGWAQITNRRGECSVTVANMVGQGKQASKTVEPLLEKGMIAAFKRETQSMLTYIQRKYQEQFDKMMRKRTF